MFHYIKTLKQLNSAESKFGREIDQLNNAINDKEIKTNELISRIKYLEDVEDESLEIIDDLNNK